MVNVNTLHYEFSLGVQKLDTDYNKDISSVDVDALLNNSKHLLQDRYVELAEKNSKIEDILSPLEIPDVLLSKSDLQEISTSYILPADYYSHLKVSAKGRCIKCQENNIIDDILTITYTQNDDREDSILKNPHTRPDWEWRRGAYNFDSRGLTFYHGKEYITDEVRLTYIRYIPDVVSVSQTESKSYVGSDLITTYTKDVHLDVPKESIFWRKMVQLAIFMYKKATYNPTNDEVNSILLTEDMRLS